MGRKRTVIEYAVYQANYVVGRDPWYSCRTFRNARRLAKRLGDGALIFRDFQQETKRGAFIGSWWSADYFFQWTGSRLLRLPLEMSQQLSKRENNGRKLI